MSEIIRDILKKGFSQMKLAADEHKIEQLLRYASLLTEWNQKINLTAITEPSQVAVKHFLDSISLLSVYTPPEGAYVVDVGSGAGLPGIPLKIMRPDLEVVLLDSLRKRVDFLTLCCQELGLAGTACVHMRAEEAGQKHYRESFDLAVSRAVANLTTLSEYCLPLVRVGGVFAALKGPAYRDELSDAERAIQLLGGNCAQAISVDILQKDIDHAIVLIDKTGHTPAKYPRSGGKPTNKPLK